MNLRKDNIIFAQKYKNLWGELKFLDEMTVILGSKRKINCNKTVFIGETTFLQEYYNDNTIVSWSHYSARELEFWQKMFIGLNKNYVNEVLKDNQFGLDELNVQYFEISDFEKQKMKQVYYLYEGNSAQGEDFKMKVKELINSYKTSIEITILWETEIKFNHQKYKQFWQFVVLKTNNSTIQLLPKCSVCKEKIDPQNLYYFLENRFDQLNENEINIISL